MNPTLTTIVISACLCGAVLLGMRVRHRLPEHHLNAETKDAVKVAVGLIATMSALVLGLLVSSAKGSYDTVRSEVIQLGTKVTFLDRLLALYGPDAAPLRAQLRIAVEEATRQMWSPNEGTSSANVHTADALYFAIQSLSPSDDAQRNLKDQALSLAAETAQLRTLMRAQSLASISRPLVVVVVAWLAIIFFSFSVFSPPNATATLALTVSALSVAGALFLIIEMDRPFTGLIRISSEPLVSALSQTPK